MLSTQFCPTCGAANEAAQTHCFACGHTLSTSTDTTTTPDTPLLHERYQLGTMLGSGGFSTVYRAHDVQAKREVAIKQINLHGLSAEEAIEATDTFNREASVLSSLQHPQIPQIYDQFSDQDHWYLVLQYLEGPTLETYLETRTTQGKPLQFDEVLEMALQLGEVLNYLHTRQPPIIFRDLKPSNIMRTPPKGRLCLVDFGIARRFRAGQQRDTQALGSPGYAAPEQYGRAQTTPRSDIYSLGALLHFLLSGDDPAEEISPGLKPLSLHTEKGEETVSELVQRMLSPDPELRPATMSEVITELKAVEQQRVAQPTAHVWQPPMPQDLPSSSAGWKQVQIQVPSSSAPLPSQTPAAQTPTSRQHGPGRRKVLIGLGGALAAVGVGGTIWGMLSHSTTSHPVASHPVASHPVASPPVDTPSQKAVYTYSGHTDAVSSVAWSPDGKYIASGSNDQTVQVWEVTTGTTLLTYRGHKDAVDSVAWSPDGKYIASSSGYIDATVQVWDAITGATLLTYRGHTDSAPSLDWSYSVAWSPDSKRIASGNEGGRVQVWEATTGKTLLTYQRDNTYVSNIVWSPDGKYIAAGFDTVQVWDATSGKTLLTYQGDQGNAAGSAAWSPNGQYIASGCYFGSAQVWEATTGKTITSHQWQGVDGPITAVAWSPNGQYIVSGTDNAYTVSDDTAMQVWEATTGRVVLSLQGKKASQNSVFSVAWSPNGEYIASDSDDNTVQVWKAPQ